jgi:hypothetical protein
MEDMQRKSLWPRFALLSTLQVKAAFANQAKPFKSLFAQTYSSVLAGHLDEENPSTFAEIKTGFLNGNFYLWVALVKLSTDEISLQPSIGLPSVFTARNCLMDSSS